MRISFRAIRLGISAAGSSRSRLSWIAAQPRRTFQPPRCL